MMTCRLLKTKIHYNPDFSGNVIIDNGTNTIEIYGDDLKDFMISFLKDKIISKMELTSNEELIDFLFK